MSFKEPIVRNIIAIAITISAALSGYFAAYTGLRVELAGKAEERYVAEMDIRLSRLEAVINERFASKDDLFNLKKEMLDKLTAIQTVLSDMEK